MTSTDNGTFAEATDPFRRELLAHCYRMLGSVHDAEDTVQEIYLQAWRGFDGFEGRSSLRTWLYRIATRACLRAIERAGRRPLPSGLGPARDPAEPLAAPRPEIPWLEPFPDPADMAESRENMRLALIAALQYLPPRQRAVLILRDVLAWRADEVASLLDITTAAANSLLQRARTRLGRVMPARDEVTEPATPEHQQLIDRYAKAFENADIPGVVRLLTEDAVFEMPPHLSWFAGPASIGQFLRTRKFSPGDMRGVRVTANGQPAFVWYLHGEAHAMHVLTVVDQRIARVTSFHDTSLLPLFVSG
jgi:RNA polymerase sigma-70 factor, ECF subfamily